MAEVTGVQKNVRAPRPSPKTYNVDLTEGEVDFILGLCLNVAGDPVNSPRKYAFRLQAALEAATNYRAESSDAARLINGSVAFSDYDDEEGVTGKEILALERGLELDLTDELASPVTVQHYHVTMADPSSVTTEVRKALKRLLRR